VTFKFYKFGGKYVGDTINYMMNIMFFNQSF